MMKSRSMLLWVLLIATAGCFRLSRESPPLQQYVLGGVARDSVSGLAGADGDATRVSGPAETTGGYAVGLRRAGVAAYLDVPLLVVRDGGHRVVTSEFHRWGENLTEGINRVVASKLAAGAPRYRVDVAPWAPRATHDFLVQLQITRFEGVREAAGNRIHVRADWDIIRPRDGRVLLRGRTDRQDGSWNGTDYSQLVARLDDALGGVAQDIRRCLSRFSTDSLAPPPRCAAP